MYESFTGSIGNSTSVMNAIVTLPGDAGNPFICQTGGRVPYRNRQVVCDLHQRDESVFHQIKV